MRVDEMLAGAGVRPLAFPWAGFPGAKLLGKPIRDVASDPSLKAAAALAVAERFSPDLLVPMTDAVLEAEALGLPVEWPEHLPPVITGHTITNLAAVRSLPELNPHRDGRFPVNCETVRLLAACSRAPVGVSLTGPFTLAGKLAGALPVIKAIAYDVPFLQALLEYSERFVVCHAAAMVKAGADLVCLSEPLAVTLSPEHFERLAGDSLRRVFASLPGSVGTMLHICGDSSHLLRQMEECGAESLSLDQRVSLPWFARNSTRRVTLVGNVDPVEVMQGDPRRVREACLALLDEMAEVPGFILSTGCGLPLETPPENIAAFMQAARDWPVGLPARRVPGPAAPATRLSVAGAATPAGAPPGEEPAGLIAAAVAAGDADRTSALVNQALAGGQGPSVLLEDGLVAGIRAVSARFDRGEVFLLELVTAAEAMKSGLAVLEPHLAGGARVGGPVVVLGTVRYDHHDIGKTLVGLMLTLNGFTVVDLGKDVAAEDFAAAIEVHSAAVVGLSALMTTTRGEMRKVIDHLAGRGLRDRVKVVVGGATVTEEYARGIGADGYAVNAVQAVSLIADLLAPRGTEGAVGGQSC